MINNIQATNYNPAFNAKLHVTPEAATFLINTQRVPAAQIESQTKALKALGKDKMLITISRLYKDMRDGIGVEIHKLVNNKVHVGKVETYFYDLKQQFDLLTMALKASADAKPNGTLSADMFKFM